MIEYSIEDRFNYKNNGWFTLYVVLVKYKNELLLKIGYCGNESVLGRLAWNKYYNDGYHINGKRGGWFDDEWNRKRIDQIVEPEKIIDEVQIFGKENTKKLEYVLRNMCVSFNFPNGVNFSGKTEYVYYNKETINTIQTFLNRLKKSERFKTKELCY